MSARKARTLPGLRRLLLWSHLGLTALLLGVSLVAGGLAIRAAFLKQAEAQVDIATVDILRRLDDGRRELAVVARLLGERPTLMTLIRQRRIDEARAFLETYAKSARIAHVRIERGGEVLVAAGPMPPTPTREGLQFDPASDTAWRAVRGGIEGLEDTRLWLAQTLPERVFAPRGDSALEVRLWPAHRLQVEDAVLTPLETSLRHVLATGEREQVAGLPDYAALRLEPLRNREGEVVGVMAVGLPGSHVEREILGWIGLLASALAVLAALAVGLSIRLARRISRPFAELARASHRLGVGDLATPLPVPARGRTLAEADALARSLDGMRTNLLELGEREQARRRELDAVLDGVDEGIVAVDGERRIQYANRRFAELFPGTAVLGRFCGDVLQPEPIDGVRPCELDCPLLRAREQGLARRTERCKGGGRMRQLVVHSSVASGARQVAIVREETAAEASRSVRDAILANLAHEFQTPLAAQVAAIEMLREHLAGSPDGAARKLVDAQYRGAIRLSQLVENLLESVRLDSGELKMRRETVDLPAIVRDALALMQPLLDQRDQRVLADLPDDPRTLHGDAQRLLQVVVNLLANANKFAPDQSRIWLQLIWGESVVSLWVEDEGPGLPPMASRADLFAPFRRSPEEEPGARGTGLGLAIVRALVERHGGEVVLASPVHHKGARIGIVLPLAGEGLP